MKQQQYQEAEFKKRNNMSDEAFNEFKSKAQNHIITLDDVNTGLVTFTPTDVSVTNASAASVQYSSGVDVLTITPADNYVVTPTDITVASGHTVNDDTPSSGIRQITFSGDGLDDKLDKIQLRQDGDNVIVKAFFESHTATVDHTFSIDFD